jgi:hypothetical protein
MVEALLKAGAEINAKWKCYSALHRFLALRQDDAALLLARAGAKLDEPDRCGRTPLHYAAAYGGTPKTLALILKKLAGSPKLVNHRDVLGFTPLHLAALRADAAMVKRLLAAGALPDVPDNSGVPPVFYAVQGGGITVYKALLEAAPVLKTLRNRKNNQGVAPALRAVRQNNLWDAQVRVAQIMGLPPVSLGFGFLENEPIEYYLSGGNVPLDRASCAELARTWQKTREQRASIARRLLAAGAKADRVLPSGDTLLHQPFFIHEATSTNADWDTCEGTDKNCSWLIMNRQAQDTPYPNEIQIFRASELASYRDDVRYFMDLGAFPETAAADFSAKDLCRNRDHKRVERTWEYDCRDIFGLK